MITLESVLMLGGLLFALSVAGIFLNRKNVILLLMCIELMLLAVNFNFVAFARHLGDLDGQSCDPAFRDLVAAELRAMGYSVALNAPFRGAELVTRHGLPAEGRHSLQIEINRRLYLDETSVETHQGFDRLKSDLDRLVARLVDFAAAEAEAAE